MTLEPEWKSFNAQIGRHFNRHLWIEKKNETNGCKKGEVKYGEAKVFQFRSTDKWPLMN